jgi:RNA polymerase sigma factor (sigma-70 family)
MNGTDDLIHTRASLLSRLRDLSDDESWKTFYDTYHRLIYRTAVRSGLLHVEAQDVLQNTLLSVKNSLPNFHYDPQKGSFKTWLLNLTRWRILDQLDKRDKHLAGRAGPRSTSTRTPTVERQPDPAGSEFEAIWDREWRLNLLQAAAARVKPRVAAKHYQIFDLVVLKEWPVTQVASFLGISAGRVYLTKHRVRKLVAKEIIRLRDKPI